MEKSERELLAKSKKGLINEIIRLNNYILLLQNQNKNLQLELRELKRVENAR